MIKNAFLRYFTTVFILLWLFLSNTHLRTILEYGTEPKRNKSIIISQKIAFYFFLEIYFKWHQSETIFLKKKKKNWIMSVRYGTVFILWVLSFQKNRHSQKIFQVLVRYYSGKINVQYLIFTKYLVTQCYYIFLYFQCLYFLLEYYYCNYRYCNFVIVW